MCGIAGVFGSRDTTSVQLMLSKLHHRGPDDEHIVALNSIVPAVLGARRLSIMDLSHGRQPLSNETETIWSMQNGEIYNYPSLRESLVSKGHVLATRCDTEILPHLYEEYQEQMAGKLDGMFAVALWDTTESKGLLIRDRIGKKPLYYTSLADKLYFASEIKSLLEIPGFSPTINKESLWHYLSYKNVPGPATIYNEINQLPPASFLVFAGGRIREITTYWHLIYGQRCSSDLEEDLCDELDALLHAAVKKRLVADVPVGFYLSGGIDSSLTTAIAAKHVGQKIKTFTLTYGAGDTTPGKEADKKWARWVSQEYATDHYEEEITQNDFLKNIDQIADHFDEPFGGVVSTYFVSRLMKGKVTAAISGDGADELFGSYFSHRLAQPMAKYILYKSTGDPSLIADLPMGIEELDRWYATEEWAWRAKLFVFTDAEKASLLHPNFFSSHDSFSTESHWKTHQEGIEGLDPLNRILAAEFSSFLPDQILTFVDRLSMAHSIEVRCPFLDTALVEFVASLPGEWKIRQGKTKYLLKKLAARYFPEEMVNRPKEGFVTPMSSWINLAHQLTDSATSSRLLREGVLQAHASKVISGDFRSLNKLNLLFMLRHWERHYNGFA